MARTVGGRRIRAPKAPPRWPPRWLNVSNVRTALRWTLALFVYGLLAVLTHWAHFRTPAPRLAVDPAAPGQFVAGLAMAHVQELAAMGVRNVGSAANEVAAPAYLLEQLRRLQGAATAAGANLQVERQQASGHFAIDFLTDFTSVYSNLTNVLAKLSWPGSASHGVLVSAHFDSAWDSVGASDDLVQVATVLEFARALIAGPALPVSVIFVLNGGEETMLQAAHGFITSHRWAADCRVAINLEAAGVGGRELLFQTGPGNGWLMSQYIRAAPHPHASVLAQELFRSGIIPGETDYRVYRDFGHIPGFDAAFVMDGWAYHNAHDSFARLAPRAGSVQRCGDNYLATLRAVAAAAELDPKHPHLATTEEGVWTVEGKGDAAVFFDVLGFFMVSYSAGTAMMMHMAAAAVLSFGTEPKHEDDGSWAGVATAVGVFFGAFVAAIVSTGALAAVLSLTSPMRWFCRPWLLVTLYGALALLVSIRFHQWSIRKWKVTQQAAYMASMMAAEVLMMLLTFAGSGIAYVPFLWVVGPLAGWLIGGPRGDSVGRLLVHLAGFAAPLLMTATILLEVVLFFTPVLGRGGTAAPPDLIVAVLMTVVAGVLGHPLIIMLVYASNPAHVPTPKAPHKDVVAGIGGYWFVRGLGGVVAASMLFTAHAPAYTAERPKRLIFQAVTREVHGLDGGVVARDAGVWINGMDFIHPHPLLKDWLKDSPLAEAVTKAQVGSRVGATAEFREHGKTMDVGAPLYTNLPWVFPIAHMFGKHVYVEAAPAAPRFEPTVALKSTQHLLDPPRRRLTLQLDGADHMLVLFDTGAGFLAHYPPPGTVHWWTLGNVTAATSMGGHFVLYTNGLSAAGAEGHSEATRAGRLTMQVDVLDSHQGPFRVVLASQELGFPQSPEVRTMVSSLPAWVTPAAWASHWRSYIF